MADLTFADSHNMVAYFEKSEANADFAEIVDFLNASSIRYALTSSAVVDHKAAVHSTSSKELLQLLTSNTSSFSLAFHQLKLYL
ncbi:hypothetical protein Tco_0529499 [Tanacetum coccineum]